MRRLYGTWTVFAVMFMLIAPAVEVPGAESQQRATRAKGGRGGGGGSDGDNTGPWPMSVMLADAPDDHIRSDGTMYVDGVNGVDATIMPGGDLLVELGGKNAARRVVYDFSVQTRTGQCEIDGNCNCVAPILMDPPFIGGDNGGWFRLNMLNVEPGMHELAVGASGAAYYTSNIPGLGTHTKDPTCTVRSKVRKNGEPADAMVRVTRTSETTWLIEGLVPHVVEYVDDPISTAIDHGDFEMAFSMTLACLDANSCPGVPEQ